MAKEKREADYTYTNPPPITWSDKRPRKILSMGTDRYVLGSTVERKQTVGEKNDAGLFQVLASRTSSENPRYCMGGFGREYFGAQTKRILV